MAPRYLKPNVKLEPLFNQWYAWPALIAPATAAMNIANHHLKLMRSYTAAPMVHAATLKNPAMIGGPFINLQGQKVDAVRDLLQRTAGEQAHMIEFAEGVKQLNKLLRDEARGGSLEPLYAKVPDALRGYVELVYDLNHQPSARFIEPLLYQSRYYQPERQTIALSLVEQDERPLVLSTPWIEDGQSLHLQVPFAHEAIDHLFRMRLQAGDVNAVADQLRVPPERRADFDNLFTDEAPPTPSKMTDDGVRVRYFGHACVLFETRHVSILTDAALSYRYPTDMPRYTFDDLPEHIDYIVLTHAHHDHVLYESLLPLRHRTGAIVVPRNAGNMADPSLRLALKHTGFDGRNGGARVIELDELDSIEFTGGRIIGLPFFGEHADLDIRSKMAHFIELEGRRFLCAADSRNIEPRLYQHLRDWLGPIDTVFLGMECEGGPLSWLYGPLLTEPIDRQRDQVRRLNGSDSALGMDLLEKLGARNVYIYAMGMEPWYSHIMGLAYTDQSPQIVESNKLIELCRQRDLSCERLFQQKEMIFPANR